jgi:hypothetical protein
MLLSIPYFGFKKDEWVVYGLRLLLNVLADSTGIIRICGILPSFLAFGNGKK